jgi:hypothetical protein
LPDRGENSISLLGITGHAIIEVRRSVRWRGYEAGKRHDVFKKSTMDKTLENTLKTGMNTYCRLVMTKESSPMMRHIQETQVVYSGEEVGKRQGAEEVIVIWTDSVV